VDTYQIFKGKLKKVCSRVTEFDFVHFEDVVEELPTINQLDNLDKHTKVIIRVDLDVPIKDGVIKDFSRIDAAMDTIKFCVDRDFKLTLFGHIGRDKENTLEPVCHALSKILNREIIFIKDWIDETNMRLDSQYIEKFKKADDNAIFMLENTRKYDIETALWKKPDENNFDIVCNHMFSIAKGLGDNICDIYINEAIAASNFDFSSAVLPLFVERAAMGFYISEEMIKHVEAVQESNMIVFSGLKIDKLDALESIVKTDKLKFIFTAGSLAMALKKAKHQLYSGEFHIGKAETDPSLKFYIPPERIEQGKRIVKMCQEKGIDLVLPIDFILDDGTESDLIPVDRVQFDIGSQTSRLIKDKIDKYIEIHNKSQEDYTLFYNGVFGKFEDPKFEQGTKNFIPLLKHMTENGIHTYVGGGEGRLALMKYGSLDDVTHAFTAGGTILKALSGNHIHYLKAMYIKFKGF